VDYTVFENQLNGRGSIRLPNGTAEGHVLAADSIAKIEVHAVEDKSEIKAAIFEAKNAAQYKSPATVAVLNEALDAATEAQLLRNLRSLADRTVVVVTHRPAALELCDRAIEFDG